uniref:Uncharacterized protein n=1 Tax=Arundo donax TaxID=35708 RepID=A0A0A8XTV6_ARUDO
MAPQGKDGLLLLSVDEKMEGRAEMSCLLLPCCGCSRWIGN